MRKILFCTLLLFLCSAIYGQQAERIINFHSDIVIDTTGIIRVTESIKVFADGDEIKRGIFRSLPLYREDKYGKKHKMNYDIISVWRDGNKEKYRAENDGEYKKIYIGNPDIYLNPGTYEYVITYESAGQISFFDDFDELYWNVTGNYWSFYIEQASASITLPNDVHSLSTSCYTGYSGSTEMNCFSEDADNIIRFETNELLSSYEGFTVAVSFPRDIIKRPPPLTELELFWEKYKYFINALICLLIFGIFFYTTWRKVGQDPEKPVVIPTFRPPHDRSPAATRFLYKRGCDDKVFTAALVGMAVKKAIRIVKDKKYTLYSIERKDNLNEEERTIYDTLFANSDNITVTDKNHKQFADANLNLTNSLQRNWKLKEYFLHNLKYVAWGAALVLALIVLYVIITANVTRAGVVFFTLPFIGLAVVSMTTKKSGKGCLTKLFKILGYVIFGALALFAALGALMTVGVLLGKTWIPGIFVLVLFVLYGIYVYLIKAPTKLGAQTTSELEGFKMYLKTAEEDRLNFLTPPEKTPELFEKLLPYAIALDVENEWGKKFTDVLKQFNYAPDWYNGNEPFSSSKFPSSFASSFTSSVSSARIDPTSSSSGGSWSSGSSGGGSSGGGGGGGGGGGW
ncbi:MAG: DUF2207 domain-containing protein [Dysgonamonadaceae bacterium]|jgi:uncharacterized membrane protein|nr:DUF2207 domain-containing protein [Dysgonamonadaceae bacterium]